MKGASGTGEIECSERLVLEGYETAFAERSVNMDTEGTIIKNIAFADVDINVLGREMVCGDKRVAVKKTSLRLLKLLVDNANVVVSRESIFKNVWGVEFDPGTKRIEVQLNYLRGILDALESSIKIKTYRGRGLCLYRSVD